MDDTFSKPPGEDQRLRSAARLTIGFVLVLWLVKIFEFASGIDLGQFGTLPREFSGLRGILFAPLIHGSWAHLVSNTAPVIVLGTAVLYGYPRSAPFVLPIIYFGSSLGVWLFARSSYHIGASGLTFGTMFFVFTVGALRWDRQAIALAMIVFFLYGGMIWGIFPSDPKISFESHFFGAAIGVTLAFVFRRRDKAPPQKRYSWEGEDEEEPWPPD